MTSKEYKSIIAKIVRNALRQHYPGLKINAVVATNGGNDITTLIARNVHARMYGANVDGIDNALWNDVEHIAKIDASELLKE